MRQRIDIIPEETYQPFKNIDTFFVYHSWLIDENDFFRLLQLEPALKVFSVSDIIWRNIQ